MNVPNNHLWELIKSLSPAEKRYFKTHFSSGSNRLTALFDILNGQSQYIESLCRTSLGVDARQFKVLKHQLRELIMKSLVANKGKRNARSKIRLGLEEVDLLLERELFAEATKRLKRLEELCARFGFTLYQHEVLERLHEIQHLELEYSDPEAARHYDRLVLLQKKLRQKQELLGIQLELDDWNPFTPERNKVLQALRERLMKVPAEHLDFSAGLFWLQSLAICSELLGKEEEATRYRTFILNNFEALPQLQAELPLSYLRVLQQAASPVRRIPRLEYVEEIAHKAQRVIARHPQYSPHYIYFLWARLRTSFLHHKWERINRRLEQGCLHHLSVYQLGEFRTAVKIYILLSITHIILQNYEQAQVYLEMYRNNKIRKEESLDYSVNLLELILYHESQDFERLASRLNYFRRQVRISSQQQQSPLYVLHLELFAEILRQPFVQDETATRLLLSIAEYPYDPLLFYYSFFNIERWLQAVAARRSWQESIAINKVRVH